MANPHHQAFCGKARAKLRSDAGETISEALVGVLIVGLATVLFATMVSAAVNISTTGTDRAQSTYNQLSALDGGALSGAAVAAGSGTVTLTGQAIDTSFAVETLVSDTNQDGASAWEFARYRLALAPDGEEGGY